jgi:hypothetical protein
MPNTEKQTYWWELTASQKEGKLVLTWEDSAEFRAQQDKIVVYKYNSFPTDPNSEIEKEHWADHEKGKKKSWETGHPYLPPMYVAWIAETYPHGPYKHVVKLVVS